MHYMRLPPRGSATRSGGARRGAGAGPLLANYCGILFQCRKNEKTESLQDIADLHFDVEMQKHDIMRSETGRSRAMMILI